MVDNIEKSIDWYTKTLKFKKNITVPELNPVYASLSNGDVDIMLYNREEFSKEIPKFENIKLGGSFVLYITVEDIQTFYDSVKNKVSIIQKLHTTDYGSTEFSLEDPDGYVLMFNQPV